MRNIHHNLYFTYRMDAVHCILDIQTAGTPTEACFISDQGL